MSERRFPSGIRIGGWQLGRFWNAVRRPMAMAAMASLALPTLVGCGPKRMKMDFIGFEQAYAATSNREMLLNLARLENHDTTYFFRLGQISSSYRMQASLTGTGTYAPLSNALGGNPTGGGTPGLLYENDPSFTFIPVNDETSAQLLLKPVPAETLYNLYLQGWRVDQLFRLMVDRIELTVPKANGGCAVQTFRNSPPAKRLGADGAPDPGYLREAGSYAAFLRVSALVYGLQKHGHLLLKGTTTFVPYDKKSGLTVDKGDAKSDAAAPKAADIAAAAAKNQSWQLEDGKWTLGQQVFGAKFYLNPIPGQEAALDPNHDPYGEIRRDIDGDSSLEGVDSGAALGRALDVLSGGFSIEEIRSGIEGDETCANVKSGKVSAHLVMRSLIGLMAAAAQEEEGLKPLLEANPTLPKTPEEPEMPFIRAIPPIERQPVLRLRWKGNERSGPPLVEVSYAGGNFEIADPASAKDTENRYWNRDMFRLVNQLTAQVTVDISKFPLPGILQLHQ